MEQLHAWTEDPRTAIQLQKALAPRVIREDCLPTSVDLIAGVDVGFEPLDPKRNVRVDPAAPSLTRAVIVVMEYPSLRVVEQVLHRQPTTMPYIPGLLSFRELPAILEAYACLEHRPDLLMVDGMGIAHPRRVGIATHLGLWLDKPSIGVGKSRLCGRHAEVPDVKGAMVPLIDKGEEVGRVMRSREGVKPLYISQGHRISLETACDWVRACLTRYKLPEPTRQADRLASRRTREGVLMREARSTGQDQA
ncbi:deoxyribonuclease V [Zymobacter palmae]|uniref:Endonuclease V n=1 Tax=Zymobacter palmae TaxID=33074 RepID=A0A348HDE5_9GAMM|nr:deoxyribonuclease V [Zymobacter palmae]BBG29647.1 deoxyinosine 3'endo nuclease [Zymobacter palmae]